jgi:hypothetical protein
MSAVTLNAGAGGAIMRVDTATSSEQVQVVKLAYGDTGTFVYASTSLPLPVIVTSGQVIQVLTSGPLQVLTSGVYLVTGTMSISSGVITLSSAGLTQIIPVTSSGVNLYTTAGMNVVSASSGLIQVLTTGTYLVTGTMSLSSGTVTLSSAPLVQTASSGSVQLVGVTSSGQSMALIYTTGGSTATNLTTAASNLKSFMFYNSSVAAFAVKIYNSTAPTIGSTTGQVMVVVAPGSTGGGGANMAFEYPGPYSSNGWSIVPTLSINATSTDAPSSNHPLNITYQV